ncbi:PC4 and SFRS1-interacting protein isoform X1 [Manduca sexta]|uniref:PWWP domain-containing protein n=1 Tax=Manduca sexta TaxID=7130 RepID=A0A921YTE1_MANSE|nr:PC4 and SFRS1-interacting protein isoform X1 [Manduca sexta]XP_030020356.1 PC4 and SFRS1-interacting protein isoform X1 [Manduca sexta]XP_030020357.1 PC4 and SFRS1-interacting protein isoform X1 [Manduca sexta]XP_030020358.1 PC4 and SFRS1-interacting protein isoform X1 [Manduca sexta]KAG6445199.1 hypothetical protein O3G_MSEX003787 [Manduca sexta]
MLKMGKKVREYKSGDFIFAKVKGYPAWPARVQRPNGKKYFVYFYGTGETANLAPNMIFDYAENKEKFLTKTVKRRDFNDGVKQIEYDFANNVPLEQVIGVPVEEPAEVVNDAANDTTNESADDTVADTTAADDTAADESAANIPQNETGVEDSDETGALVIDEGKVIPKGRKSKVEAAKTPAKEPAKPIKEPKIPRGKAKKEEAKEDEEEKKDEELVSRSGRKIRPKRYIDEQTEDNTTLPSPAPKKRRGASPASDKDKENVKEKQDKDKTVKHFNAVSQSELEDLKEPFKPEDPEKDNILIAYLPNGQYVGIKLFQPKPASFKNESTRLQWDKQAATNAITLKSQLEKGQITAQSVLGQLVMDLNLTDEEKATLDKERETEEKKSRVQFLKTEMKLIELEAKIKTCLCLEKADTELCLKLLAEMMELEVKPLMLLKHPTCLETVKRMRAYVGNTTSWDLSESAALLFSKQAHLIRVQADTLYKNMKELFTTPKGLSFWEFFSERVVQFKKATAKLTVDELLELVHEPLEMSVPTSHTMTAAIDAANEEEKETPEEEEQAQKKKSPPAKKKVANSNAKTPVKRQSSRKLQQEEKEKEQNNKPEEAETVENDDKDSEKDKESTDKEKEKEVVDDKPPENNIEPETKEPEEDKQMEVDQAEKEESPNEKEAEKSPESDDSKAEKTEEKEKESGEPRAKRTRESKKTEPPPRSPAKRKAKC